MEQNRKAITGTPLLLMKKRTWLQFFFVAILIAPCFCKGQISGNISYETHSGSDQTVFRRKTNMPSVCIKAYGLSEAGKYEVIAQTWSDKSGGYVLNVPVGKHVRLTFEDESKMLGSSGLTPAIRFVRSPATDVNWVGYVPEFYVSSKPFLVSPVYINGSGSDNLSALKAVALEDTAIISLASSKQVGALWAVAFNKTTQHLYSAAFAKRHVGYGPLGTGGIYRTNWKTRTTTNWLDLNSLGIPTGDDHHSGLKAAVDSSNVDSQFMADVGKLSFGGMDISESDQTLYVMNLFNRTLYGIKLPADTASRPNAIDVTAYAIPPSANAGGTSRPFAVKVHGNQVYVGVVYDAQQSQSMKDLKATVYVLDVATRKFNEVFSMPLDYVKGRAVAGLDIKNWFPWTDDFNMALYASMPSTAMRPQPLLASLAFDEDGAMILGFMDRFGHQSGTGQPDPNGKASYTAVAAGDILRVFPRKPGNKNVKFTVEENAVAGQVSSDGKGNMQGPKGGEFFFQDGFNFKDEFRNGRVIHEETGAGGVLVIPQTGEVLMTAHEPTSEFNSGGIKSFFNEDGKTNRGWLLYRNAQPGTFGKANGVGGLALSSDLPPIVAGNRVWSDINRDGVQDAQEPGVAGVKLELWWNNNKLATTFTDQEGSYLFSEHNVPGGLKPATSYEIHIDLKSQNLNVTINKGCTDQELDSDGVTKEGVGTPGMAIAAFTTRGAGAHVHDLDFGILTVDNREKSSISQDGLLVVYPNPVVDKANVDVQLANSRGKLILIDLKGRKMHEQKFKNQNGTFKTVLNLAHLPPGSYVVGLEEKGSKTRSVTIVKE